MARRNTKRQKSLFLTAADLPKSGGHPFYVKLIRLLTAAKFGERIEVRYRQYCDARPIGRPSIPPSVYCHKLLVGYLEVIDSQQVIAWRCADSLPLREFLGTLLTKHAPHHATLSIICQRLPTIVFEGGFEFHLEAHSREKAH